VEEIKRRSRQYAKRQLTWFRREKDVIWLNKQEFGYQEDAILEEILNRWAEKTRS
jgi:tRNA dimethylallyltransferase